MKYTIEKVENGWLLKKEAYNYHYLTSISYSPQQSLGPSPHYEYKQWIAKDADELYSIFKKLELDDTLKTIKG